MLHNILGLVSALAMFAASLPLLYIAVRVQQKTLRTLSILLGVFSLVHGVYHVGFLVGLAELSQILIGPFSALLLAIFAIYYFRRGGSI